MCKRGRASDEKEGSQVENAISSHLKLIRHTAVKLW